MTEAIETISSLSPLAAVVIIAGVAAMALTQAAKQPSMTKARVQALSVGVSIVLGTIAYIVSGVAAVFPPPSWRPSPPVSSSSRVSPSPPGPRTAC